MISTRRNPELSRPKKLLNIDANAKTVKGQKQGYMTAILYLAPAKLSGYEVCPQRSAGCTAACLNTAGRGNMSGVQKARIAKTQWYFEDRYGFMVQLVKELSAFVRKAERAGFIPVVRLNGTSDISWERVPVTSEILHDVGAIPAQNAGHAALLATGRATNVMAVFPAVQFYDYTKVTKRALAGARGELPDNYKLTFSLTEANDQDALSVLQAGGNVAVVFKGPGLPPGVVFSDHQNGNVRVVRLHAAWGDYPIPVVDGDLNDLRFLDRRQVVVGLKAKGKARHDTSGFARP